jgi:Flp pilus assembly protein TadB
MKSQILTKAQVAGILVNEFKENNVWLQIFLLSFICIGGINLFVSPLSQLLTLVIVLVQFVALYALYNSNRNKVKEFEEKYAEVL